MNILALDRQIMLAMVDYTQSHPTFEMAVAFIAKYLIYGLPFFLILLWLSQPRLREVALTATLAGLFAVWPTASLLGSFLFRQRPFLTPGVKELVFHLPDKSFPSDHAALLMALTTFFYLAGLKKLSAWFLLLTLIISWARVMVALHYPLDMLGGIIIGAIIGGLFWLVAKYPMQFFKRIGL